MVGTLHFDYRYVAASDSELDALLRGEDVSRKVDVDVLSHRPLHIGETGVLVELRTHSDRPLRPLALVARDEDVRRLCGRYAQLRTELSPLTAWCHLLTPSLLRSLDGIVQEPSFKGTEAAWSGLVVAETMLLTQMPLANIRISACLASATYAIGRTRALWRDLFVDAIVERFDAANRLCRGRNGSQKNQTRTCRVRSSFVPMWNSLSALMADSTESGQEELQPLVMALKALREARSCGDPDEAELLVRPLLGAVPEARAFGQLAAMPPESRLGLFDELVSTLRESDAGAFLRHNALALTAGYLATVAAGGAASLALVDDYAEKWPELTGWAYLVGSIGERITWTSGFDGLGRLIARELQRPLRLNEAPMCDFALDEAVVLSDAQLKDPLVHLKIKQARVLSVALYPGVNIAVPIVEAVARESTDRSHGTPKLASNEVPLGTGRSLEVLAGALWPYIRPFVIHETAQSSVSEGGDQKGRRMKKAADSRLPLRGSTK